MSDDGSKSEVLESVRVREVLGLVKSRDALDRLVDDLTSAGFDRADIDLMSSRATAMEVLGGENKDEYTKEEAPDAKRIHLTKADDRMAATALVFGTLVTIGTLGASVPIVASGGALAAIAAAALAGGATGAGLASILKDRLLTGGEHFDLEEALRQGGIVVVVRVRDPEAEARAQEIMRRNGVESVHVHEVELQKTLEDVPLSSINPDPWLGDDHSVSH